MMYQIKQAVVYGGKYTKDDKECTWCALSIGLTNAVTCPLQGAGLTIRMWLDEASAETTIKELTTPNVANKIPELSSGSKWAYKVTDSEKISAIAWLSAEINNKDAGFGIETLTFAEKRMLVGPDGMEIHGKDGKAITATSTTVWWFDGILGLDKNRQVSRESNKWVQPKSNEEQLAERLAALRALIMG